MIYKNIKNKKKRININSKAIEEKEKELNKFKKEYNNLKINLIKKDTNNKSYNINYKTIYHKNVTSLIGNNKRKNKQESTKKNQWI